jgi:hypothetical protein
LRSVRLTLTVSLVGAAALYPAGAAATTPHISGPIVSYKCPPVPLWCTKKVKAGIGGWPGVTLTHIRAKMRSGPAQDIYKLSWKLGDPHAQLLAEALNPPNANGNIRLGRISAWAHASAPAGFVGAINADFFGVVSGNWSLGHPSGMLVRSRKVVDFGSGSYDVGYKADGEMVMGQPMARPTKVTLRSGHTATVASYNPSSAALANILGDQVAIKTNRAEPINVPSGWVGFVVGSVATPSPFEGMLQGSEKVANSTGLHMSETVRAFRFGEGTGTVTTVSPPVSNSTCVTYVCAGGTQVQLQAGQVLMITRAGHFADKDLEPLATGSAHRITVAVDTPRWSAVQDVMGGKPRLVKNGTVSYPIPNGNPPMMSSDGWQWRYPHWRPAVAETKTRGWLIITGGVHYGDGVPGWNWGKMLVQLGAQNAMGFDNNSSTELYVPGTGTYSFSPGWERDITEATALSYH